MTAAQPPARNPTPAPPLWTRAAARPWRRRRRSRSSASSSRASSACSSSPTSRRALGASTLVIGSLLALVPLAVVLLAVRWIDRWEPEPRWALWFAFLWGAAVSVAIALIVDLGVQLAHRVREPGGSPDEAVQAVVQAPLVEETAKGIGVLLIFAFSRSHFDGPVDGLVYAATAAAGFAFTENILYFGDRARRGRRRRAGRDLRGARHLLAVRPRAVHGVHRHRDRHRRAPRRRAGRDRLVPAGLAGAVLLHALWNGSLAFADDAIGLYFTVQVPIFLGAIAAHRAPAAPGGAHHPGATRGVRRGRLVQPRRGGDARHPGGSHGRRRAWARAQTPPRTALMRKLITDATHLAFTRQRMRHRTRRPARGASTSTRCCRPSRRTARRCCAEPTAGRSPAAPGMRGPGTRKLAALWCGNADISTGRRVLGFQSA